MKVKEVWYDGKCNKCGKNVYETSLSDEDWDKEEARFADYKMLAQMKIAKKIIGIM